MPTPTVVIQPSVTVASFNASLDGIVAWLADASGTLAAQTPVANDIDSLKEQFHHHEVGLLPLRGRVYVTARCPSDCLSVLSFGHCCRMTGQVNSAFRFSAHVACCRSSVFHWQHCHVLPVLWMASRLHITSSWYRRRKKSVSHMPTVTYQGQHRIGSTA